MIFFEKNILIVKYFWFLSCIILDMSRFCMWVFFISIYGDVVFEEFEWMLKFLWNKCCNWSYINKMLFYI